MVMVNKMDYCSLVWFPRGNGRRVLAFTAVAVLRFCTPGLIISPVARSVLAYCVHVAIPLALRGKARRAPYTDERHTCMRRLLAVGVTLESTEIICNKDDICGCARVGCPPLRRYESATRDRLEMAREWATVTLYITKALEAIVAAEMTMRPGFALHSHFLISQVFWFEYLIWKKNLLCRLRNASNCPIMIFRHKK